MWAQAAGRHTEVEHCILQPRAIWAVYVQLVTSNMANELLLLVC